MFFQHSFPSMPQWRLLPSPDIHQLAMHTAGEAGGIPRELSGFVIRGGSPLINQHHLTAQRLHQENSFLQEEVEDVGLGRCLYCHGVGVVTRRHSSHFLSANYEVIEVQCFPYWVFVTLKRYEQPPTNQLIKSTIQPMIQQIGRASCRERV